MTKKDLKKKTKDELIEMLLQKSTTPRKIVVPIKGFNNSHLGLKSYGGEEFTKSKITVSLQDDILSWSTKRYTPSGLGKGGTKEYRGETTISEKEKKTIDKKGFFEFVIEKLEIPKYLEIEFPSNLFFVKNSIEQKMANR